MSDETIKNESIFFEHKKYAYYLFFFLSAIIFFNMGMNSPYTIEYKISNVLLWSILILLIPDTVIKLYEVLACIKVRLDEKLN
jgi:hypothetical protein